MKFALWCSAILLALCYSFPASAQDPSPTPAKPQKPAVKKPIVKEFRDLTLLELFPEAAGAPPTVVTPDFETKSDLNPDHIANFEPRFEAYLQEEMDAARIPTTSLTWWKTNIGTNLKKGFMNHGADTVETLAVKIGRVNRNLLAEDAAKPDSNSSSKIWTWVKWVGGSAVVVTGAEAIKSAYTTGPLAQFANASLANWIRGPVEDLQTASSNLKKGLTELLSSNKGKFTVKDIKEANGIVNEMEKYASNQRDFMNEFNFMNVSPKQAEEFVKHLRGQAQSAFNSQTTTTAPYMREGRANILDAQARPIMYSANMGIANGNRMLALDRVEEMRKKLEANGIFSRKIDKILKLQTQLFESTNFERPPVENPAEYRAGIEKEINSLKEEITKNAEEFQAKEIHSLLEKNGITSQSHDELFSISQLYESDPQASAEKMRSFLEKNGDSSHTPKSIDQLTTKVWELLDHNKIGKDAASTHLKDLIDHQKIFLLSKQQMGTTMAAWWDHDVRFPELNIKMAKELQAIPGVMKRGEGFPEYLSMDGVQADMKYILGKMYSDFKDSKVMLEEKLVDVAGGPEAAKAILAAANCEKGFRWLRWLPGRK